ncbi:hypothetical protein [Streptomyces sp. T21Q-yed]|uniref:hypothetical protein n=1 Tax=Streptomyces sp. T21Q-yed TaxID=3018441 RepID=UPI0023DE9449|nr:hypothetical protein [Streptomyces sp. T21Q-yed]MDF3140944.1 hypothetical protein [Streptomyces sp. T21Q-yed]
MSPVALVHDPRDGLLLFRGENSLIGDARPKRPFDSNVHAWGSAPPHAAGLTLWPGHGAWTVAWTSSNKAAFVQCHQGTYTAHPIGPRSACHGLALAPAPKGSGTRLVAPLTDQGSLAFCNLNESGTGHDLSYSSAVPDRTRLWGIAVPPDTRPTHYWVGSPDGRHIRPYRITADKFDEPVPLPHEEDPRDLAFSAAGEALWVATAGPVILRYVLGTGAWTTVDTPAPAERLRPSPDGGLWFSCPENDTIGYVAPGGTEARAVEFDSGSRPTDITTTSDGEMWVALAGTHELVRLALYELRPVEGDHQQTRAGKPFPRRLRVKAVRMDGTAVSHARIDFTTTDRGLRFGGTKDTDSQFSDNQGIATSAPLHGLEPGTWSAQAHWIDTADTVRFDGLRVTKGK